MKKFSICIPNYNYEHYIGKTLQSVYSQTFNNFEVIVCDNKSTDQSVKVITQFAVQNENLRLKVNECNLGFAGNLDECGRMANAEWMIMLSSDDMMCEDALKDYHQLIQIITRKNPNEQFIVSSTFEKIGPDDEFIDYIGPQHSSIYSSDDIDVDLSNELGVTIYKVASGKLLHRCLQKFHNPFNFAATCYLNTTYKKVGGYGGARMMNPDKWFHWKILGETDYCYIIDKPLFKYRWHPNNQTALLEKSGVLKFWLDEYRNTFELDNQLLARAGLSKSEVEHNFNTHLLKYVALHIKEGNLNLSKKLLKFGESCYAESIVKNPLYRKVKLVSSMGKLGQLVLTKLT